MIDIYKYSNGDYFNQSDETKDFMQRMYFLDFVEGWEDLNNIEDDLHYYSLELLIQSYIIHHEELEDYEVCKLLKDILARYEKEIIKFDN